MVYFHIEIDLHFNKLFCCHNITRIINVEGIIRGWTQVVISQIQGICIKQPVVGHKNGDH
jgi:hypothetical protein